MYHCTLHIAHREKPTNFGVSHLKDLDFPQGDKVGYLDGEGKGWKEGTTNHEVSAFVDASKYVMPVSVESQGLMVQHTLHNQSAATHGHDRGRVVRNVAHVSRCTKVPPGCGEGVVVEVHLVLQNADGLLGVSRLQAELIPIVG